MKLRVGDGRCFIKSDESIEIFYLILWSEMGIEHLMFRSSNERKILNF